MADYTYMTIKINLIFHAFFSLNSMTTHITFAKNYINIVTVFVCGYRPPRFKTANNIASIQQFH